MKNSIPRRRRFLLGLAVLLVLAQTAAAQIGPARLLWRLRRWRDYALRHQRHLQHHATNASQQTNGRESPGGRPAPPCRAASAARSPTRRRLWNQASNTCDGRTTRTGGGRRSSNRLPSVRPSKSYRPAQRWRRRLRSSPRPRRPPWSPGPRRTNDIIQWRPILYDRRFDALRAAGGSPLSPQRRQAAQPADRGGLPQHDQGLRANEGRPEADGHEISAREYLDTCQDIDGLIKQSRDRAERLEAAAAEAKAKSAPAAPKAAQAAEKGS